MTDRASSSSIPVSHPPESRPEGAEPSQPGGGSTTSARLRSFRRSLALRVRAPASILLILCLLVWLSRMILPDELASSALDRSWKEGLGYALERGWRAGVDYVFTFGPLGFFSSGTYFPHLFWMKLFGWEGLFQLLVAVVLTMAGAGIGRGPTRVLYFLLILLLPVEPDSHAFLSMVAVVAWMAQPRDRRGRAAAIGAVVLAVFSLVKFTYSMAALVCVLAATAILWRSVSKRAGGLFLVSFLGLAASAWWICGQSLSSFPTYVARSIQVSSGYSEAMSRSIPPGTTVLAAALLGCALLAAGLHAFSAPPTHSRVATALSTAIVIWIAYKAGLVRGGEHAPIFFQCAAAAPLLLGTGKGVGPPMKRAIKQVSGVARCACAGLGILGLCVARDLAGSALPGLVVDAGRRVIVHAGALLDPLAFRTRADALVLEGKGWRAMPRTRQVVGKSTIDMVSWRQTLLFQSGLEWRPRPVFQSYVTFTPELMDLNARFLESERAPEFILFYLQSIDTRFPTMDDATALQVIARDYKPVLMEKDHLLLRRELRASSSMPAETLLKKEVAFGESIDLRALPGRCHLLRLDIQYTLAGRLRTVLDAAPPLIAEIHLDTGESLAGRIIPGMMRSGIIIDPVILTQADWAWWYTGKSLPRPVAFRVLSPKSSWMYQPRIGVEVVRADGIAPPPRPGLETALLYSLFPTPPAEVISSRPPRRGLILDQEVLLLPAPSRMRIGVAPGPRRLTGQFGILVAAIRGSDTDGDDFSAILTQPGKEDVVLFQRHLDPLHVDADRKMQPLDVQFQVDAPADLWLRADPGARGNADRDGSCWAEISLE